MPEFHPYTFQQWEPLNTIFHLCLIQLMFLSLVIGKIQTNAQCFLKFSSEIGGKNKNENLKVQPREVQHMFKTSISQILHLILKFTGVLCHSSCGFLNNKKEYILWTERKIIKLTRALHLPMRSTYLVTQNFTKTLHKNFSCFTQEKPDVL